MQRKKTVNVDYSELMTILSRPRLNGSAALRETRRQLSQWLDTREIANSVHTYTLYPYFIELGGLWLFVTQVLFAFAVWQLWGWGALLIVIVSLSVMVLEIQGRHLVSGLLRTQGENIVVEFEPSAEATQELILSAHYDSKTELFDDLLRGFFNSKMPIAMLVSLLVGVLAALSGFLGIESTAGQIIYYVSLVGAVATLFVYIPVAVNFVFGRFASPSQGAVDNGAACIILFDLAQQIASKQIELKHTKVTMVIFSGEEVVVQGSRAYVADRHFPYPTQALNLELMGQNGGYLIWKSVGSVFGQSPTDEQLNTALADIIESAETPLFHHSGPAGTDSLPFGQAEIPCTTLATVDAEISLDGLHTPQDNVDRISEVSMQDTVSVLKRLIGTLN